jgi:hypothetical protein
MSISSGYVRCHGCDYEGIMQRRPITLEYVLPSGAVVQGYRVFVWCSSCENVTEAEDAFDAALIQTEIDSRRRHQVGVFGRLFGGGKVEDVELKHLQDRLQLAQLRRSGSRCLRCGESTVVPLTFDESGTSNIVHTCGRRLFAVPEDPDAPRFMFRPEVIRLDPEGRKV